MKKTIFILLATSIFNSNSMNCLIKQSLENREPEFLDKNFNTVLHSYILLGFKDFEACKKIIENCPYINFQNTGGTTALECAIRKCAEEESEINSFYLQVIEELLKNKKLDINLQNFEQESYLHIASRILWKNKTLKYLVIIMLLNKGIDINLQCQHGWTPCMWVLQIEEEYVFKLLFNLNKINIKTHSNLKGSLLHIAVERGFENLVLKFLELGADVNAKNYLNQTNVTPLQVAIYQRNLRKQFSIDKKFENIEKILREAGAQ
ncbi:ankyrin repeat domain-containing protein [Candidatus Dependentiae bacterium]|nr:ankyrin repeat domain-containing protein [Candidatus Dependentiae bacterium]